MVTKQKIQGLNQEYDVEIYFLNDYPELLEEFTAQGKFGVWSSIDGISYHLFVEKGYYEKVKPLYDQKINEQWLRFWDKCEEQTSRLRRWVLPVMGVVLAIVLLAYFLIPSRVPQTIVMLGAPLCLIVYVLLFRKKVNETIMLANSHSVEEIKKIMGASKFEKLLEDQRSYLDEYFQYDKEEEQELAKQEVVEKISNNEPTAHKAESNVIDEPKDDSKTDI